MLESKDRKNKQLIIYTGNFLCCLVPVFPILSSIAVLYHVDDYSVTAKGAIALFCLYVLFFQFKPRDVLQGINSNN